MDNSGDPGYSGLRAGGVENELYLLIAARAVILAGSKVRGHANSATNLFVKPKLN